jgi:hypothetical protein
VTAVSAPVAPSRTHSCPLETNARSRSLENAPRLTAGSGVDDNAVFAWPLKPRSYTRKPTTQVVRTAASPMRRRRRSRCLASLKRASASAESSVEMGPRVGMAVRFVGTKAMAGPLPNALHERDELIALVAALACESNELLRLDQHGALLRRSGHDRVATTTQLQQAFIAEDAQGSKNRVRIDAEHRSQVSRLRNPLSRSGLPVRDRSADLPP